jgi:hypothetical protein
MSSWMQRLTGTGGGYDTPQRQGTNSSLQGQKRRASISAPPKDLNIPKKRLQIHQRCLYERNLPGNAFISAHVNRLQHGFYESTSLHEDNIDNLYFVAIHFVFHPHDPRSHRFKSADIKVCVHGDEGPSSSSEKSWTPPPRSHPRILKHAPELMFGAVSPENLQWNFSLSSSLGVSQAPVSATLNPSGGMNGTYKVYHMMSIQGSVRSIRSPLGSNYDVEDAMAVWTLEENLLQQSGLPREFDFVLLVHKPDDVKNVYLTVDHTRTGTRTCRSTSPHRTSPSTSMRTSANDLCRAIQDAASTLPVCRIRSTSMLQCLELCIPQTTQREKTTWPKTRKKPGTPSSMTERRSELPQRPRMHNNQRHRLLGVAERLGRTKRAAQHPTDTIGHPKT